MKKRVRSGPKLQTSSDGRTQVHHSSFCRSCGEEVGASWRHLSEHVHIPHYHYVTHRKGCPESYHASTWTKICAFFGRYKISESEFYELECPYIETRCVKVPTKAGWTDTRDTP